MSELATVGVVHEGTVPEKDGACLSIQTERGEKIWKTKNGKTYNKKTLDKAKNFWFEKVELRKNPENCGRCGKPNPSKTHKHCEACREYQKRRKLSKQSKPITVESNQLDNLNRRVSSLEHAVTLLQLANRKIHQRYYNLKQKQRNKNKYFDAYPNITKQELSSINHAYLSPKKHE